MSVPLQLFLIFLGEEPSRDDCLTANFEVHHNRRIHPGKVKHSHWCEVFSLLWVAH